MRTVLLATVPFFLMLNIGCAGPEAVVVPVPVSVADPAGPVIDWNMNVDGVTMRTQAGTSGMSFGFTTPEGESITMGASESGVVLDVQIPPL